MQITSDVVPHKVVRLDPSYQSAQLGCVHAGEETGTLGLEKRSSIPRELTSLLPLRASILTMKPVGGLVSSRGVSFPHTICIARTKDASFALLRSGIFRWVFVGEVGDAVVVVMARWRWWG